MYSNGEGDYTEVRREKINNLDRADFLEFLKERGELQA